MDEQQSIGQQINEARRDFAIEDDFDFITSRIASLPTAKGPGAHWAQHHQPSRPDDNLTRESDHRAIMTPHTARAADDFETIRQRMTALRLQRDGKCAIREGKSSADCWCYQAGPDGSTLPCPPPVDDGPNA